MNNSLKRKLEAYLAENVEEEILSEETSAEESFSDEVPNFYKPPAPRSSQKPSTARFYSARREINFDKIFEQNVGETFSEMLLRLVDESGEKNSAIYNRALIDRQLFSRIKKNKNYQPSKDTAVAFAIALELDLAATKDLLATAGFTLSKNKRDVIISFFIENKLFDVNELNDCLYEYNQDILGG